MYVRSSHYWYIHSVCFGAGFVPQDGSVRLISPVTGDIITTFFPIFTADVILNTSVFPFSYSLFPNTASILSLFLIISSPFLFPLFATLFLSQILSLFLFFSYLYSFPLASSSLSLFLPQILSEVVYCPMCGLLFALLAAGEVLVVASLTNPCSTLQLWTSTNREKIQTISTVCVTHTTRC